MACLGWTGAGSCCCIGLVSECVKGKGLDGLCPVFGSGLTWRAARLTVVWLYYYIIVWRVAYCENDYTQTHTHTPIYIQRHMKAATDLAKHSYRQTTNQVPDTETHSIYVHTKIRQKHTRPDIEWCTEIDRKFEWTGNDTLCDYSIHKR